MVRKHRKTQCFVAFSYSIHLSSNGCSLKFRLNLNRISIVFNKGMLDHNPTGCYILHLEFKGNPFPLEYDNSVRVEA